MHRGLAYWTDGKIERLLLGTHDAYLISVDAKTGALDKSFGEGGRIDLMGSLAHAVRATNYSVSAAPVDLQGRGRRRREHSRRPDAQGVAAR